MGFYPRLRVESHDRTIQYIRALLTGCLFGRAYSNGTRYSQNLKPHINWWASLAGYYQAKIGGRFGRMPTPPSVVTDGVHLQLSGHIYRIKPAPKIS